MQVVAQRQLKGDYGSVVPGQVFELHDDHVEDFIRRGLVSHRYDRKDITPKEQPAKVPVKSPKAPVERKASDDKALSIGGEVR